MMCEICFFNVLKSLVGLAGLSYPELLVPPDTELSHPSFPPSEELPLNVTCQTICFPGGYAHNQFLPVAHAQAV